MSRCNARAWCQVWRTGGACTCQNVSWVPTLCSVQGTSTICQTFAERLLWAKPGAAPRGTRSGKPGSPLPFQKRKGGGEGSTSEVSPVCHGFPAHQLCNGQAPAGGCGGTRQLKQGHSTEHLRQKVKSDKLSTKGKQNTQWGNNADVMLSLLRNPYLPFASQNAAQVQPFKSIATDQICRASKTGILVLPLGRRGWELFCFAFPFLVILCVFFATC